MIKKVPGIRLFQAYSAANFSAPNPSYVRGNLTPAQRGKLILHERCNHINFKQLNSWIHHGLLAVDPAVANAPDPLSCACQYGKAKKKSHSGNTSSITASHIAPGQGISAAQLEAGYPGCIPTTHGLPTPKQYKLINLWVDHYSRYIYPTFHATKELKELLASKQEFELFAKRHGVALDAIRAHNGVMLPLDSVLTVMKKVKT
jgi:hypothetical protein